MRVQDSLTQRLLAGAIGGLIATVPMTILMRTWHKQLPRTQQYPLPPEVITTRVAREAGAEAEPHRPGWEWKTYAGHFGFGASAGAAYGVIAGKKARSSPVAKGIFWGMLVWTSSYLGWLPAVHLHPRATHEPAERNALMVAAHVVWGSVLGMIVAQLKQATSMHRHRPAFVNRRVGTGLRDLRSAAARVRA